MCIRSCYKESMHLQIIVIFLSLICSSFSQSFFDTLIETNFSNSVLFPTDEAYRSSVVMANYDCKFLCPYAVVRPESAEEVSVAVSIAKSFNMSLSIRGGGHGYTCQGAKSGGIMLDMRKLKGIEIHGINPTNPEMSMTIGTGLTWGEVLKHLKSLDSDLITVHGQCTSVGVAGYALHGGVHFGGLSELYGLASDNILALTAVVANGSIVHLTGSSCLTDGVSQEYTGECRDLWSAFRGAGSSFGVVTSLTLKLYREPKLQSALSILSLKIRDPTEAQRYLSAYIRSIPDEVSLTFFGLDAYFKAYSFTLLFSSKKRKALFYDILSLIPKNSEPTVHFIVEASWPVFPTNSSSDAHMGTKAKGDVILSKLEEVHSQLSQHDKDSNRIAVSRAWLVTKRTWSVPSYDLVWGAGHSYGGATIIVDMEFEEVTIERSLERMKLHEGKATGKCSDCVIVFHRIGENLKNGVRRGGLSVGSEAHSGVHFESFNPFRQNGSLWVEMDCGHFYPQRDSWAQCTAFIDDSQRALDGCAPRGHKSHYPNVPNLVTQDWRQQYYGDEGYKSLQKVKQIWDPENFFYHSQSVSSASSDAPSLGVEDGPDGVSAEGGSANGTCPASSVKYWGNEKDDSSLQRHCVKMYDSSANRDLRNRLDVTRVLARLVERFKSAPKPLPSPPSPSPSP